MLAHNRGVHYAEPTSAGTQTWAHAKRNHRNTSQPSSLHRAYRSRTSKPRRSRVATTHTAVLWGWRSSAHQAGLKPQTHPLLDAMKEQPAISDGAAQCQTEPNKTSKCNMTRRMHAHSRDTCTTQPHHQRTTSTQHNSITALQPHSTGPATDCTTHKQFTPAVHTL